jgi:hypothetical protein
MGGLDEVAAGGIHLGGVRVGGWGCVGVYGVWRCVCGVWGLGHRREEAG